MDLAKEVGVGIQQLEAAARGRRRRVLHRRPPAPRARIVAPGQGRVPAYRAQDRRGPSGPDRRRRQLDRARPRARQHQHRRLPRAVPRPCGPMGARSSQPRLLGRIRRAHRPAIVAEPGRFHRLGRAQGFRHVRRQRRGLSHRGRFVVAARCALRAVGRRHSAASGARARRHRAHQRQIPAHLRRRRAAHRGEPFGRGAGASLHQIARGQGARRAWPRRRQAQGHPRTRLRRQRESHGRHHRPAVESTGAGTRTCR